MSLHLTRDEADRLAADGRGVLFRAGDLEAGCLARWPEAASGEYHPNCCRFPKSCSVRKVPPAEFVEAAQACECKCHNQPPEMWIPPHGGGTCPDCHNGKRRIAAVVPCKDCARGGGDHPTRSNLECPCLDGHVTVGHVVVTWGPLVAVDHYKFDILGGHPFVFVSGVGPGLHRWDGYSWHRLTLPPDVDPQSLIGQYALGVEVAP